MTIKVGDRFAMTDGTIARCVKKRRGDLYDFAFYWHGERVGVPAFNISGAIVRARDAGFRDKLRTDVRIYNP